MAGPVAAEGLERRENTVTRLACILTGGAALVGGGVGGRGFHLSFAAVFFIVWWVNWKMALGQEDQASGGVLFLRGGAVLRRDGGEAGTKAVVVEGEGNR